MRRRTHLAGAALVATRLATALSLMLLGCGGDDESEAVSAETIELVLWHPYRGGEQQAFEKTVAAFNAQDNGVRIRSQAIPYDPFVDKITIAVPRGQGPDLFTFAHNMIGNWVEKGVLQPLSGRVERETLTQFLPDTVRAMVYRKNLYGLPLAFKPLVMFYNKELLPEPPATMEELVARVKPLQTDQRFGLVYAAGGLYFHAMWIHAFGGTLFDAEHEPAFDTPEQLAALEYVRGLHLDDEIIPRGVSGFMVTSLFNAGNAAVVLNGPWFRPEIDERVDYGVATIPTVGGRTPRPLLGVEAIFVTRTSEHKDAAIEAALYLAGPEAARVRMLEGDQPVCVTSVLEAGAAADPHLKVFMEQARQAVPIDASPEMQHLWTPADAAITAGVFSPDRDPRAELAKAQAKMVSAIEETQK